MYLAIEGVDCSGKSTQISFLKEALHNAVFTREPGATKLGMQIREIVLNDNNISDISRFLMFLADRAEHMQKVIMPNIANKKDLISDRSFISGMAYHIANNPSADIKTIFELNLFALSNILPEKVIFLNIPKDVLINRLSAKDLDAIEVKGIDYMMSVQNAIKTSLQYSKINFLEIDASLTPKEINKMIMDYI
ncbi:MAG: dTMP kinase [Pseudomonadota bacterium]|jgi:dTMP kinase